MLGERVCLLTKLSNNELNALRHQTGDEVHIATQAVEFRHQDRRAKSAASPEGRRELGTTVKRVGALPSLYFGEPFDDLDMFTLREGPDGRSLGVEAQARTPLFFGGNPRICHCFHGTALIYRCIK
jgi:hypothetical protein